MAKQNTIEHWKTFRLADLLEVETWAALGLLEAFWDWTGRQAQSGDVSRFALSQIADGVKWRGDPRRLMHLLRSCEVVDELPGGRLYVHDYHDHAPDMVRKRLERAGKSFANGMPARMPKEGYAAAGHVSPEPLPYAPGGDGTAVSWRDYGETSSRHEAERKPIAARRRRDVVSPEASENGVRGELAASLVRAEAHPIPSHPIQGEISSLSEIGGGTADPPDPSRAGPSPGAGPLPVSDLAGPEPRAAPPGGLPTYEPGRGREFLDRYREPGESDAHALQRYRAERLAADGLRPPMAEGDDDGR